VADDQNDKTEPATEKKRQDARNKGSVAQSRELQTAILLGAALAVLGSGFALSLAQGIVSLSDAAWSGAHPRTLADFHAVLLRTFMTAGAGAIPIMLLVSLAGAGAALVQIGPLFSLEALKPQASRLSLAKGMKRMADLDRLFDLGKALFKVTVVGTIVWKTVGPELHRIVGMSAVPLSQSLPIAGGLARDAALTSVVFLGAMAALDLLYQRARFEKRLRMTKKEVRDELRDREGNPHVRNRARAVQREMSRARMIAAVADASVVVTNPTHYAVALQYLPERAAPLVIAKGRDHVARRIREVALENDVPIVENRPLARLLHRSAKVGEDIPEALYQAVAEVLAYVYRLRPNRATGWSSRP